MNKKQINELLQSLTIEEKIAQLCELGGIFFAQEEIKTGPMHAIGLNEQTLAYVGTTLNVTGAKRCCDIQKKHLQSCPKKVPLLFLADIIFGYKTIFPIPLAIAGTFNNKLFELFAKTQAKEASISGVHGTFYPMLDLVRDPRWGRVMESFGEDPFLGRNFAKHIIIGLQQGDLKKKYTVASCLKHFAGYGAAEAGREYNQANISNRLLHEMYLPPFKEAIKQGAKMVMPSFNVIDLVPASCNEYLLKTILRKDWGFEGVIVSDYSAIRELIPHGVASNELEAAIKALKASVDIDMMSGVYLRNLESAIIQKQIDVKILDEAVLRILNLKNELGLFENPFRFCKVEEEGKFNKEYQEAAFKVALESMVLLKNDDNILPLSLSESTLFLGPFLDSKRLNGSWAMFADIEQNTTIKEELCKLGVRESFYTLDLLNLNEEEIATIILRASKVDKIVMFIGEAAWESGEDKSKTDISIKKEYIKFIKKIHLVNHNIITVLINGRPLILSDLVNYTKAIFEAWLPGNQGAKALVNLLYGYHTPSGKLTMTFPRNVGQIPIYYNTYNTGRPYKEGILEEYSSRYRDCPNTPLYPFGFGLSYTSFQFLGIKLNSKTLNKDEKLIIEVEIKNIGKYDGKEVIQLYIQDLSASVTRPILELKGYQKIFLKVEEQTKVEFFISQEDLKFYDINMNYIAEEGEFTIFIGNSSANLPLKENFFYKK